MSEVSIFEGALGAAVTVLSGAFGIVWKRQDRHEDQDEKNYSDFYRALDEQRDKLSNHKEALARDYITKVDFNRLEAKIDRLGDILKGHGA